MANMSHCRFRNTLQDLRDCYDNMDEELSPEEAKAQNALLLLCARIASDYEHEIELAREQQSMLRKRAPETSRG